MKKAVLKPPVVVFVRPQSQGNLGALSRVMSNFGVTELRLVGEKIEHPFREGDPFSKMDWALAKRGALILESSRWFLSLSEALEDIHLVIGSSGREDHYELGYARPYVYPHEAFGEVQKFQENQGKENFRWALVLGPEDDGLKADEAALCQKLIRIPTHSMNRSMNAAMAAGVLLYHASIFGLGPSAEEHAGAFLKVDPSKRGREPGRSEWANQDQKESFLEYLMDSLSKTSFLKYPDTEAVRARIRRWLQAAPIPLGELLFAFEIVYHFRAWGSGQFESRDFLKKTKKT